MYKIFSYIRNIKINTNDTITIVGFILLIVLFILPLILISIATLSVERIETKETNRITKSRKCW